MTSTILNEIILEGVKCKSLHITRKNRCSFLRIYIFMFWKIRAFGHKDLLLHNSNNNSNMILLSAYKLYLNFKILFACVLGFF